MSDFLKHLFLVFIIVFGECGCDILKPPIPDPGSWYPNGPCPSGTFIKALRLKYAYKKGLITGSRRASVEVDPVGYSDESGLKFLEMFCANTGIFDQRVWVKSMYSLDDEYSYLTCPGNTYASSYQLFFTSKKDPRANALSNSWYLGPHQIANTSASSLRLFCGRDHESGGFLGFQEDYGPMSSSATVCGHSWTNQSDFGMLCKLETNKKSWHNDEAQEREMTWAGSFASSCCLSKDFICSGGSTGYETVKVCDNTRGRAPIGCPFERRVGVSYRQESIHYDQSPEPEDAIALQALDIKSQQKMGLTLNNVGPTIFKNVAYREGFNTSTLPATVSEEKNHGTVTFTVPAGQKSRIRQLYGRCGIYQINSDVFEVIDWDASGKEVMNFSDAYPLKTRTLAK